MYLNRNTPPPPHTHTSWCASHISGLRCLPVVNSMIGGYSEVVDHSGLGFLISNVQETLDRV